MPRQARIDAPGALHPIIARGIERREIFCDDEDRDETPKNINFEFTHMRILPYGSLPGKSISSLLAHRCG